jgi:NADH-quinone oxidoreductase subunit G
VPELGGIGRGEHMEVGTYVGKAISSELSGNMIDICPVGALTSKPYAFKARSWELKKTESIDVLDAVGSNIRVDSRGMQVMRILPRLNEDINEEWISDKTRFSYDGLYVQRLDRPMVRKMGKLTHVSWTEAFAAIKETMGNLNPAQVGALVGDLADAESIFALKDLMDKVGVDNLDCRQNHVKLDHKHRVSYLFNSTIAGIEKSDLCILVGANPRYEATMINARLRKRFLAGHFEIAAIGKIDDLTYPVRDLGDDLAVLDKLLDESHLFSEKLKQAKNPMIIIGETVLARDDGDAILAKCKQLSDKFGIVREGWNGFNILHTAASRVAALDLGFVPSNKGYNTKEILEATRSGDIKLLYLLGADEIDIEKLGSSFVIYQGHHGDRAAHRADVILPGAAYTEKNATYVNLEGRVQRTYIATPPPGEAKEDWQIIKLVADSLGYNLSYNNIDSLRQKMVEYAPHFAAVGKITPAKWVDFIESKNKVLDQKLDATSKNYYMTNPISRASKIMAECIKVIWKKEEVV